MEGEVKDVVENISADEGEGASGGEKENINPVVNFAAAVVDGEGRGAAVHGAVVGSSGVQQGRPGLVVDGGVGGVLESIPEEKLIEICRSAVQRMRTLQRTEFAGHFSGVLANDTNAFGPIIRVSGYVCSFVLLLFVLFFLSVFVEFS